VGDEPADELGGLEAWVAEQRTDDAIAARARAGWLRHEAEQSATWVGVLLDLAERAGRLLVQTVDGRSWSGTAELVSHDHLEMSTAGGRLLVRHDACAWVQVHDPLGAPTGDRAPRRSSGIAEALAELAATRCELVVWAGRAGEPVRGRLLSASPETLALRPGRGPAVAIVRVQSISEVLVPATSG